VLALGQHRPSPSSLQYVDPPGLIRPDKTPACSQDSTLVANILPPPCSPPDANTRSGIDRLLGQVPGTQCTQQFDVYPSTSPLPSNNDAHYVRQDQTRFLRRHLSVASLVTPDIPHVVYDIGLGFPPLFVVAACNSNNPWLLPVAVILPAYQRAYRWRGPSSPCMCATPPYS
jgi:hypothetical protein